ncbi:MAG: DUF512 domain-containing protein [Clostridia bacterium]|nr:DUF512 domain-containing protein [Clostridia bacterium]
MANVVAVIAKIEENSLAEELGLEIGDKILEINGQNPLDLIDYQILWANEEIELLIEKNQSSEQILYAIEKDFDEGLGVVFERAVFDKMRTCHNRCKFCFVEQMAPEMRKTLYTKDDDYRLSFLQGNFITLTNLVQADLERIKNLRLSPLYVSVHTTDPDLRRELLCNENAGQILEQLKELTQAGIEIHAQVVLCKNFNDGAYLEKTIDDLSQLSPGIKSLAIVPVGVTKFRKNLEDFPEFDKIYVQGLIQNIEAKQKYFKEKLDNSFVFLSDEFYLRGDWDFPEASVYEDFPQLENGVGLSRIFIDEFELLKPSLPKAIKPRKYYVVAGVLGGQVLAPIINHLSQIKGLEIDLRILENTFFGPRVTVTGLLTGTDLLQGLKNLESGAKVIIPDILLKRGESLFLDNLTPQEIKEKLDVELIIINTTAQGLVEALLK